MPRFKTIAMLAAALLAGPLHAQDPADLRDPTRPWSARLSSAHAPVPFRITALFVAADRRVAIINGKRVVEGDRVDGATVASIREDRVQLKLRGKEIVVHLLPAVSRK